MAELGSVFKADIIQGRVIMSPTERGALNAALSNMLGPVDIIIRPRSKAQSDSQRKYYWGVVLKLISDHTGEEPGMLHAQLKKRHGIISTTKLNSREFHDFVERVRAAAATELNVSIPDPEKVSGWEE